MCVFFLSRAYSGKLLLLGQKAEEIINFSGPSGSVTAVSFAVLEMCLEKVLGLGKLHMVGLCLQHLPREFERGHKVTLTSLESSFIFKSQSLLAGGRLSLQSFRREVGMCISGCRRASPHVCVREATYGMEAKTQKERNCQQMVEAGPSLVF
jgi:hypothetical protein